MGALTLLLAGVIGALIGAVGVGGVLLAPALVGVGGMEPHAAAATSIWAFLFTGIVGTLAYARHGTIPWPMLLRLTVGVAPSAFAGARVNALLPSGVVLAVLATVTVLVGVHQLLPGTDRTTGAPLGTGRLIAIGVVVGFGSALTGTGGPVLLIPILLALGVAPLVAVAVSQAVQLPVVVAASVGYLQTGLTDLALGTALGVAAAVGVVAGAGVAHGLDPGLLRRAVALACIGAGIALLLNAVLG